MDDDEADFRKFVTLHWSPLVAAAFLITTDRDLAEDCVQDAMVQLHRHWQSVGQDGEPSGYANQAVVQAASEQISEGLDGRDSLGGVDGATLAELRSVLPQRRAALALRYLEGRFGAETRTETETAARPGDPDHALPTDLPDLTDLTDLTERAHRLAEDATADSKPWPRVDRALRRAQRRRLAGLSAVTAVGVLIAGIVYAGLAEPATEAATTSATKPAAPLDPTLTAASLRRKGLAQLRKAGYGRPTGGSLGGDAGWVAQVRERARDLVANLPADGGRAVLSSPDEVLVPWTGQLGEVRYALAFYPSEPFAAAPSEEPQPAFAAVVLTGDQPDRMTVQSTLPWSEPQGDQITTGQLIQLTPGDPADDAPATVVVLGPTLTGVKVVSAQHFSPKGKVITRSRQLSKDGAMAWLGQLSAAERYINDIQLEGVNGYSANAWPVSPVSSRIRAIAPSGTDPVSLDCASGPAPDLGSSIEDRPKIATTAPMSSEDTLSVAVLRSPGGAWLASFCQLHVPKTGDAGGTSTNHGGVFAEVGGSDDFMAAVETPDRPFADGFGAYLVLAPADATTVRMGTETAKVKNRLAYFRYDEDRTGPRTVRALNAAGTVIATVRSQPGQ